MKKFAIGAVIFILTGSLPLFARSPESGTALKHPCSLACRMDRNWIFWYYLPGFQGEFEWSAGRSLSLSISAGAYGFVNDPTPGRAPYRWICDAGLSAKFYIHGAGDAAQQGFWVGASAGVLSYNLTASQAFAGVSTGYKFLLGKRKVFFLEPFAGYDYVVPTADNAVLDAGADHPGIEIGLNVGGYFGYR